MSTARHLASAGLGVVAIAGASWWIFGRAEPSSHDPAFDTRLIGSVERAEHDAIAADIPSRAVAPANSDTAVRIEGAAWGPARHDGYAAMRLPLTALPPDPRWNLNPAQLRQYTELAENFLAATDPGVGEGGDSAEAKRRWTQLCDENDEKFRQLFGSELYLQQQTRVAAAADAAH